MISAVSWGNRLMGVVRSLNGSDFFVKLYPSFQNTRTALQQQKQSATLPEQMQQLE